MFPRRDSVAAPSTFTSPNLVSQSGPCKQQKMPATAVAAAEATILLFASSFVCFVAFHDRLLS